MEENLTGKKFGKLTVLQKINRKKNGSWLWLCKCDCGNEKEATTRDLNGKRVRSCGCGKEAAKQSPKSGRFETNVNAIEWHLISPEGEHFFFRSLNNWLRENGEKYFGCEPDSAQYKNVRSGLSGAKRAMLGGKYGCTTYKGWQALPVEGEKNKCQE